MSENCNPQDAFNSSQEVPKKGQIKQMYFNNFNNKKTTFFFFNFNVINIEYYFFDEMRVLNSCKSSSLVLAMMLA